MKLAMAVDDCNEVFVYRLRAFIVTSHKAFTFIFNVFLHLFHPSSLILHPWLF